VRGDDRPRLQSFAYPCQFALKSCPVVRGSDGPFGQLSDPLHSFTNRPPSSWFGCLTGNGLQCAEHPHHNGNVARTILPDLVEGFGQQTFEARASDNEAQFSLIQAVGGGKLTGRKPDRRRLFPGQDLDCLMEKSSGLFSFFTHFLVTG